MQHLAIFTGQALDKILAGKKRVESRFARDRRLPFEAIKNGDEIFLKKSGGQVLGKTRVRRVLFYKNLNARRVQDIADKYNDRILGPKNFWDEHKKAKFATLLFLERPEIFAKPIDIKKKDRRAWILMGREALPDKKDQLPLHLSEYDSWSELRAQVKKIAQREDWQKYYREADLTMMLMQALGLLAEEFQGQNNRILPRTAQREQLVRDRIGDMLMVLIYLAERFDLDLYKACKQRLTRGKRKQPLERLLR